MLLCSIPSLISLCRLCTRDANANSDNLYCNGVSGRRRRDWWPKQARLGGKVARKVESAAESKKGKGRLLSSIFDQGLHID